MDYVNLQVAIGGDHGNTVPKFAVPVSELPVLLAIHGEDSLFDLEVVDAPEDQEELASAEELKRLHQIYGAVSDGEGVSILRQVYPGVGAKIVEELEALSLPEGVFKVLTRATPKAAKEAAKEAAKQRSAKAVKPGAKEPVVEPVVEPNGNPASDVMG